MSPVNTADDQDATSPGHASGAAAFVGEGAGALAEAGPIGIAIGIALFPVAWLVSKLWHRRHNA